MRVLMLSKACIVGIYQRKLEEIARHPDVTLRVLVPPSWKDERGETQLERAFTDGYELTVTPIRLNGNFHLHYYPEFTKQLHDFQPDIVHIDEEPYNLATWLALRATRQMEAKTLFFSWQNIARRYPPPFSWMEQTALRTVDYALVGTESSAEVWRIKGYQGKMAVIPQFGVDPELFTPVQRTSQHMPFMIGFAGRLVSEKGVDLLLNTLATLTDLDWRLKIIGGGPERNRLEQQAEHLNIAGRVEFVGLVPSIEMPSHLQQLDALVIPSRTLPNWKEQYGRVIIEAMASEVAVVGSNSAAIPDVVGHAGLIFPENDVPQLACHLRQLMEDRDFCISLGKRGRQRILENFTQAQIAAQTVAVYREMLNSAQNGGA
ncbi:MAG: glycosyl transferase family 1 [Chloroflexota bacterium]|nr:glycosyltransferase [Chloroflexota bacterium]NOG65315.1 glycosyltransferase [Chloroflexota bacterium]GIK66702.1 MAG: glycosyl transferase family 1 [Chloroflexota bacterium]